MAVSLREYQAQAIERAREHMRNGARNVLVYAPTGSGKTQIASHLIEESVRKGKRSVFSVDLLSLVDQTSRTFDGHSIEHGVIQGDHPRFRPHLPVQIVSVHTIAKRKEEWPDADLIIVDECHTRNKVVERRIARRDAKTIGLSATPFAKGLGQLYDAIVNVTTTNKLIEQGWLSKFRIFSCVEPDLTGVRVVKGEFERQETEKRALTIVGDVVAEYQKHGEDRKFICSALDTAHVTELARQFLAVGINVGTYTYKDLKEDRTETVEEFRKPNSRIRGLITVTAASKGFDIPDIGCVIMARPLRKSLAEHIQFMGRGLRIADGKVDCLILDHSGNCARFWHDWNRVFEIGVAELDDGKKRETPAVKPKPESEMMKCPSCHHLHLARPFCPACGHEYPKRGSVQHEIGSLKELLASGSAAEVRKSIWPQVCWYVRNMRKPSDDAHAQRMAQGIYFDLTGSTAHARIEATKLQPISDELRGKIRANTIRWSKGRGSRPSPVLRSADTVSTGSLL